MVEGEDVISGFTENIFGDFGFNDIDSVFADDDGYITISADDPDLMAVAYENWDLHEYVNWYDQCFVPGFKYDAANKDDLLDLAQ